MRKLLFVLVFVIQLIPAFAQTQKDEKVEKAINLFNSGKMDKAISKMEKIKNKKSSNENWSTLVQMYYQRYLYAKDLEHQAMVAAFGEVFGIKKETEKYKSSYSCFVDLLKISRDAELYSECPYASQFLRNYLIDSNPDTTISDEAKKKLQEAEKYFEKKDFINSKKQYQEALSIDSNYYDATIYLGDCYWYLGEMDSAIYYFHKGIAMCPDQLEPRKYLVDALAYSKKNMEAKKECIEALYIYPDISMFMKFSDLAKQEGKKFNRHWIKRGCEINTIKWNEAKVKDNLWKTYQNADSQIKEYCDSNGVIVKQNTLTKAKYLEVYSWEKMLNSTTELPEEMRFAKKMADNGYLDCYVFMSAFHFDLYNQFSDFVKNNKDRIKTYIETYLVE
jgi:tetratricopeptide (TPR) repeat protein